MTDDPLDHDLGRQLSAGERLFNAALELGDFSRLELAETAGVAYSSTHGFVEAGVALGNIEPVCEASHGEMIYRLNV